MWFLCIIDMVIWERWGIIKHSSIYKGRLARSLRVSEWDRHLWKVRYSQVQDEMRRKPLHPPTNFLPLLGSPQPLGVVFPPENEPPEHTTVEVTLHTVTWHFNMFMVFHSGFRDLTLVRRRTSGQIQTALYRTCLPTIWLLRVATSWMRFRSMTGIGEGGGV